MADDEDFYSGLERMFTLDGGASNESSSFFSPEDVSSWIRAVEIYVKKTGASRLDLTAIKLEFHVLESVMDFLSDSQVTELVLEQFDVLGENMKCFCQLLKKSKVQLLNINQCNISYDDLVALVEILNDTEIVDLNAAVYYGSSDQDQRELDIKKGEILVSAILRSHLNRLDLNLQELLDDSGILLLANGLKDTSLTFLDLQWGCVKNPSVFASTISKLSHCSVVDLNLCGNEIGRHSIEDLSKNLVSSRLQKLDLSFSEIDDGALDILTQGLVLSNIIELNLGYNNILGLNHFGRCVKNTKIKVLSLSCNVIRHREMFAFPEFLKDSLVESLDLCLMELSDELGAELFKSFKFTKVSKLNLRGNQLKLLSISVFSEVLKDTSLEEISFLGINFPTRAFDILGESGCFNGSKLKYLRFQAPDKPEKTTSFLRFLEKTKNPSSFSVEIEGGVSCDLSARHAELLARTFIGTNITHLSIVCCQLDGAFVASLAPHLQYTSIAFLDFTYNNINDTGVMTLAEHLKQTEVFSLNLSFNPITNTGAKAIGILFTRSSLIHLNLDNTDIENDGLEILAESFSGSLVTNLSVSNTLGKNILPIHKILWENRVLSHNLLAFFKQLAPDSDGNFCFHQCIHNRDIGDFLEECLQFYKKVIEQPAAISVLWQEESLPFLRKELVILLFDVFPHQFVDFINSWIEADVPQRVKFLRRAEELKLVKIVELLLLLRPLYTIDEAEGILHPFVYPLLLKYKQPICNIAVEPSGVVKIIDYFTQHINVEGAANVINLLSVLKTV